MKAVSMDAPLIEPHSAGLYCPAGDFFIDPWRKVDKAIVTHAHSDHARPGSAQYVVAAAGIPLFRSRLGRDARLHGLAYGEPLQVNGVRVSLHPAGHMLGAAQVRLESRGQVCVVSGDYKLDPDPTCPTFEPVRCHHFVSESTFALPVYRWPPVAEIQADLNAWWRYNQSQGRVSILYGYALGKAQRLIALLDPALGPIYTSGTVDLGVAVYREAGVQLPPTTPLAKESKHRDLKQAMVIAVPGTHGGNWMKRFPQSATAMASGWMLLRGPRRNLSMDRGFPLSDHADWPGLLTAIQATGAERVWITHGYKEVLARYLGDQGLNASVLETQFVGESLHAESEPSPVDSRELETPSHPLTRIE